MEERRRVWGKVGGMVNVYVFDLENDYNYCRAVMLKGMGYRLKSRGKSKYKDGYDNYYTVMETEKSDVGEILHDLHKVVLCRGGNFVVELNEDEYVDVEARDLAEHFGYRHILNVEKECDIYYDIKDLTYCLPILYYDVYDDYDEWEYDDVYDEYDEWDE